MITGNGQRLSKQDLEIMFIAETNFNAMLVLKLFANMSVETFSRANIAEYYNPIHWPGMQSKLFKVAYDTLFDQMTALVNIHAIKGGKDGKKYLLNAALNYPKS